MFRRPVEMGAVARLLDERRQRFDRRANVADHAEIDRRAAADLFGPHVHLCDAYSRAARIELAIRKIGAEHQEHVAIEHRVVARREADQPGHADVKRIVPLDMFLASERVHDGSLQAIGQREDLIMRALTSRTAQHGHAAIAVEERGEPIDIDAWRHRDRLAGQQASRFRRRRVRGGLKRHVARNHHDRDAAIADRLPDRDLQNAGHLVGPRDQLTIVTALLEQVLRMGFLEISGADLGRRDLRRNRKHRHARAVTIEQAIDEVQIAGSAAAGADRELSCQVRLGAGRESRDLLVPDMHPFDLALASQSVGQAIQAVADDAIDPLDARCSEGLRKLISYCFCHIVLLGRDGRVINIHTSPFQYSLTSYFRTSSTHVVSSPRRGISRL